MSHGACELYVQLGGMRMRDVYDKCVGVIN